MYLLDKVFAEELQKEEARMVGPSDGRTIMAVCRDNYQSWLSTLFPMWSRRGINCHEEVARILRENGYPDAKAATVSTCMTRLHKEKGLSKTKARRAILGVTPPPVAVPVEPVSSGMVKVPVQAPSVPPATVRADQSGSLQWVDPVLEQMDGRYEGLVRDWPAELARVRKEQEAVWSEADEDLWQHLLHLKVSRRIGVYRNEWLARGGGAVVADVWLSIVSKRRDLGLPRPKL